MPKLIIEYRTKDNDNDYFKENTYFTFTIEDKTTQISIAPSETRLLKEIIYAIEKQLQDGYHLKQDEKFEISEFDMQIMDTEESLGHRVNFRVYN